MNSLELLELNFNDLMSINGGVDKESMWYKLGYAVGTYLFEHGIPGK